jgi:hypothetical protein
MAARFMKAAAKQARLKVGFYGPPGSGKTFTALLLAEGLAKAEGKRIAVLDTERGTDFYSLKAPRAVHPEAFDFDALYTKSLADVTEAVHALDPHEHAVVVIDSISHLWDAAIDAYQGKKTKGDGIPMPAWAQIKKPYKSLVRHLLDSPLHVIICGRQKNVFDTNDQGEMVKAGVGMRAEGETEYEPHVCIRMEVRRGDSTVYAVFEKDRTGILANRTIPNPSFSTFAPMLDLLGTEQAASEDPDEVAARDSELLAADSDKAKGREAKSAALFAEYSGAIAGAATMEALTEVAAGLKKIKRYLIDGHEEGLRTLYAAKHAAVSATLAPAGV